MRLSRRKNERNCYCKIIDKKKEIPGTSGQAEENYLKETLRVVHENVKSYSSEVARMQEDIDEMLEHYHDNDAEVFTILNNTITLHDHMERAPETK